jgi:hypothetical protein
VNFFNPDLFNPDFLKRIAFWVKKKIKGHWIENTFVLTFFESPHETRTLSDAVNSGQRSLFEEKFVSF